MKSVKLPTLDAESNATKTTIKIKRGKRETVDDDGWSPMRPVEIKIDAGFKVSKCTDAEYLTNEQHL